MNNSQKISQAAHIGILGVILCSFIGALGVNMMSVSMDLLQTQFGEEPDVISLVSSSYFMAQVVAMPAVPILVRRYGLDKVTYGAILLFSITSLLCALAQNIYALALFRGFQGVAGGVFAPLVFLYIKHFLPGTKHAKYLAYFSVSASVAIVLGPTLVALIPEGSSLGFLFILNLPAMALCAFMVRSLPEKNALKDNASLSFRITLSLLSLSVCLGALVFLLDRGQQYGWTESNTIINTITLFIITFWIFVALQYKSKNRLLDYTLLYSPRLLFVYLCSFISGGCIYTIMFVIPLYLSTSQQYDAMLINQVLLLSAIPQLLLMPVFAHLVRRTNPILMSSIGALLFGLSCLMSSSMSADYAAEQFFWPQVLRVVALPLFAMPLTLLSMMSVTVKDMPSSSTYFSIFRLLGAAVALSMMVSYVEYTRNAATNDMLSYISWPQQTSHQDVYNTVNNIANILAFNNVFFIMAIILFGFSLLLLFTYLFDKQHQGRYFASYDGGKPC